MSLLKLGRDFVVVMMKNWKGCVYLIARFPRILGVGGIPGGNIVVLD